MKLPEVNYARPPSLENAVALLSDPDAKILSGGQSLIPMMAFRLATPGLLVDIGRIPGLNEIRFEHGDVVLGARVRWRDIEKDAKLALVHPLLLEGVSHIAHYNIRNRGTVGGSLAHADPAAELPALAIACEARIKVFGAAGRRVIQASDFFVGPLTTVLGRAEIITEITLPAWKSGRKFAFEEFARRRGDFALAGACISYDIDDDERIVDPRVVAFGAVEMPTRVADVERFLAGRRMDAATCELTGGIACDAIVACGDAGASPEYRRSLFGTLVERGLARSMRRGRQ